MEVEGIIKISDGSDSESEDMDTDSNSSPESLQDNDDVIFVNHIDGPTGRSGLRSYWEVAYQLWIGKNIAQDFAICVLSQFVKYVSVCEFFLLLCFKHRKLQAILGIKYSGFAQQLPQRVLKHAVLKMASFTGM